MVKISLQKWRPRGSNTCSVTRISNTRAVNNLCLLYLSCLVPRPHYYARPMRFGSRGPRKFSRPRQTRRSETFWLFTIYHKFLEIPVGMYMVNDFLVRPTGKFPGQTEILKR